LFALYLGLCLFSLRPSTIQVGKIDKISVACIILRHNAFGLKVAVVSIKNVAMNFATIRMVDARGMDASSRTWIVTVLSTI
ncbi:unnamed protein product, partial [Allacma fusca]